VTTFRTTLTRLAAVVATAATVVGLAAGPTQANASGTNYIQNAGSVGGIGVMHLWDGNYGQGLYDVVLPQGRFSSSQFGWSYTEGFYIGSGYCAQLWDRYNASDGWSRTTSDIAGPAQVYTSRYYYWKVVPYRC
jgi:hypothetical protein